MAKSSTGCVQPSLMACAQRGKLDECRTRGERPKILGGWIPTLSRITPSPE